MALARSTAARISLTACLTALLTIPAIAATESVYYTFKKNSGSYGTATLLNVNGALYGTTQIGGDNQQGTVYKITKSGAERVLHSFGGKGDGRVPLAGLILFDGTLYGTTYAGGAYGDGTVFAITAAGTETVLHSFSGLDGVLPEAPLLNVNGTLYGTTISGGKHGCGTVFSITPAGSENTVYSFRKQTTGDGCEPAAGLIHVEDTLYGTTTAGGSGGSGTIFSVTLDGAERVLHSFSNSGSDGYNPTTSLTKVGSKFFGTTPSGGAVDDGVVYSVTRAGEFKVVHSFTATYYEPNDGAQPGGLINIGGTLYGATASNYYFTEYFCGTVFSMTPDGVETVLHDFAGTPDACGPDYHSSLTNVDGTLYGTTYYGGTNGISTDGIRGFGAIYKLVP